MCENKKRQQKDWRKLHTSALLMLIHLMHAIWSHFFYSLYLLAHIALHNWSVWLVRVLGFGFGRSSGWSKVREREREIKKGAKINMVLSPRAEFLFWHLKPRSRFNNACLYLTRTRYRNHWRIFCLPPLNKKTKVSQRLIACIYGVDGQKK